MKYATLAATSAANETTIHKNIEYLHLQLLSEQTSPKQINELFALFKIYETNITPNITNTTKTQTNWVAVCSNLIHNTRWITY